MKVRAAKGTIKGTTREKVSENVRKERATQDLKPRSWYQCLNFVFRWVPDLMKDSFTFEILA